MFRKIILIMASLVFLAACAGSGSVSDDLLPGDEKEVAAFEGTIEPLELSLYQKGTHRLIADTGMEILIASPTVNLNNYMENKVEIEGVFQGTLDRNQRVLIVRAVRFIEEGAGSGGTYRNRSFGFNFTYPGNYELTEEPDQLVLSQGGIDRITVDLFRTKKTLNEFIQDREVEDGTEVTVAGQPALRFTGDNKIRLYVSNPGGSVYLFSFVEDGEDPDRERRRQDFYDVLESVTILYYKKITGESCGGPEDLTCPAGFRCELDSGDEDAFGVCVDPANVTGDAICPFVAPPKNCEDFKVSGFNAENCPVSYECLDEPMESPTEASTDEHPESDSGEQPAEESGEKSAEKPMEEPVDESVDESAASHPTVPAPSPPRGDLTRSYENTVHHFSVFYHKNWYFKSFGAKKGALWLVGFSDKSLKEPADALITLRMVEGSQKDRRSREEGGVVTFLVPRDDKSHFTLGGPSSLRLLIEEMAQSLVAGN